MLDAGTPMQNSKCTAQGWTTVFSEKAGTGNGAQYDTSDIRTLNLVKPPFDVKKGNYRVRMEWGNGGWAEFTVSNGSDRGELMMRIAVELIWIH